MKENSVLQVLMYLFKNHFGDNAQLTKDSTDIIEELETAGFIRPVINQALGWLTSLIIQEAEELKTPTETSFRVFSDFERDIIPADGQNLILSLERQGILNTTTREQVIHQILDLHNEGVDTGLIKWVTLMVLFNSPNETAALSGMELLVLDSAVGGIQ